MTDTKARPPLGSERIPSLEEMGVKPEECGVGHPHIDARILDACRLIVQRIEEDAERFQIAFENLEGERARRGRLSRASEEWRAILDRPWAEIRALLLEESDEGQRLRSSHPFPRSHQSRGEPRNRRPTSAPVVSTGLETATPAIARTHGATPRRQTLTVVTRDQLEHALRAVKTVTGRVRVRHHRQPSHPGAIPERSRGTPRLPGDRHLRPRQAGGFRLYPRGMRRTHRLPANARLLH